MHEQVWKNAANKVKSKPFRMYFGKQQMIIMAN